ncbi:class I SAM-dependent methyltransferase [Hyphobacterium sp. CCMP332]|nr:class I SAM-dependent methyltransferase [Hyphobacterium sp. CCMP332]
MKDYKTLKEHYEKKLKEHGPTARGMDWPNPEDLDSRFKVLTSIIAEKNVTLLDLGCGAGLLIDFMKRNQLDDITYFGSDISEKMISAAKEKYTDNEFEVRDILDQPYEQGQFDYVIMNGVLTEKREMSQAQMIDFAQNIIQSAFKSCRKGLAFNVMSTHVDWKREDLFHWELDEVVSFLVAKCSRHIRILMDYGLYEYTVHIRKELM